MILWDLISTNLRTTARGLPNKGTAASCRFDAGGLSHTPQLTGGTAVVDGERPARVYTPVVAPLITTYISQHHACAQTSRPRQKGSLFSSRQHETGSKLFPCQKKSKSSRQRTVFNVSTTQHTHTHKHAPQKGEGGSFVGRHPSVRPRLRACA